MKIALFTDTYKPDVNGIVSAVDTLRKALEKEGYEVYVFAPGSRKIKEMNEDSHVFYFTSAAFKKYPDFRLALFPFISTVEIAKKLEIDIIHNHAVGSMALAAVQCMNKLKIPGVATFHHLHYLAEEKSLSYDLAVRYMRWLYARFNSVIAPSFYAFERLKKLGINAKELPNPINYKFYSSMRKKPKRRTYDFLYVGSMERSKNLSLIIDHTRNIVNVAKKKPTFLMVGEGSEKQSLEERAYIKGISDYFLWTGLLSKEKLREVYWKSKTFLYPSHFDTQAISALESMAAGVIPIAPEESALKGIIKDGVNGFIYKDGMDFYRKAVESLSSTKEMRKEATKTAEGFSWKALRDSYITLYEKLVKK